MPVVLYIASIVGALALVLMLPKRGVNLPVVGALLGAAALGGAWLALSSVYLADGVRFAGPWYWTDSAGERTGLIYYYVFSALAIVAAVRVITHRRPVYSALWFVLVILSSAGLFLTLSAEFMAFAMIIIYAGAILVTYMFVIMLATQSADPDFKAADTGAYDVASRDPVAATAAGFLLLAVLLTVAFDPTLAPNPEAFGLPDDVVRAEILTERSATAVAMEQFPELEAMPAGTTAPAHAVELSSPERVGLDLFMQHPLGLELAGVILTVSLIGAVTIARTRVPEEEAGDAAAATREPQTGATAHPTHEAGPDEPEAFGRGGGMRPGGTI